MKFGPLIAIILLSGCLDEDIADAFVADGGQPPLSIVASESRGFVCVVAIYRASSPQTFPDWMIISSLGALFHFRIVFMMRQSKCVLSSALARAGMRKFGR